MRYEGGPRSRMLAKRSAFVEKRHWAASIAAVPIPVVVIQDAAHCTSRRELFDVFGLGRHITARLIRHRADCIEGIRHQPDAAGSMIARMLPLHLGMRQSGPNA